MEYLDKYNIPFRGLKEGIHTFVFEVDDKFFEYFEGSLVKSGNIKIHLDLTKKAQLLVLEFKITGEIYTQCNRCLGDMALPIAYSGTVYVKFTQAATNDEEDIIFLSPEEDILRLASTFYDYINLCMPYKVIHPEDEQGESTCDKAMLEKLKEHTKGDKNTATDPRWDELKKLLN